jgi:hypothetical protein
MTRAFLAFLGFIAAVGTVLTSHVSPAAPISFTLIVCTFAILDTLDKLVPSQGPEVPHPIWTPPPWPKQ